MDTDKQINITDSKVKTSSSSFLSEEESALVELPPTKVKDKNEFEKQKLQAIPEFIVFAVSGICKNIFNFSKWFTKTIWNYLVLHPSHAAFSILLVVALTGVGLLGSQIHNKLLTQETSESTIDTIVEASSFTRDFSSKNANTPGSRELIRSGAPKWMQKESVKAVLFHARKNRLSLEHQAVLLATVEVESGFNPMARAATTTACGLFQFVKATGHLFGLPQDDCMNPWLNAEAGVSHYLNNYKMKVEPRTKNLNGIEKAFKTFELTYYLHHDGTYSSNHSSEVKAVVLRGTQFLLQAHNALSRELKEKEKAPNFLERLLSHLSKIPHYFNLK